MRKLARALTLLLAFALLLPDVSVLAQSRRGRGSTGRQGSSAVRSSRGNRSFSRGVVAPAARSGRGYNRGYRHHGLDAGLLGAAIIGAAAASAVRPKIHTETYVVPVREYPMGVRRFWAHHGWRCWDPETGEVWACPPGECREFPRGDLP